MVTWGLHEKGAEDYTPGVASVDLDVSSTRFPPMRHSVNVHLKGRGENSLPHTGKSPHNSRGSDKGSLVRLFWLCFAAVQHFL